ncbi:hypothetical protein OG21DRAFT_1490867 [Imleria badia]|nr:hypothetical protein OG21DRAFT_1490867 [Imleria badia]
MHAHTPPPRNVVTSASITPYQLKTASIPTLARIYSAVPLKQDFINELADATIVEPDAKKPKQHYILYPYHDLPLCQATAPDPFILTHNNQPLYHSTSKSWDPAHLPHVLRNPMSDYKEPSPMHAKRREPAIHKKKNRTCRSMTVTRKYHGVEGPMQETQDSAYLLKAGSEEQTLALWLNHFMAYICTHCFPSSQPADVRQLTRSQTRGKVECMQHHWSAESSTKAQRIEDTDLQLKPNITLLQQDDYDEEYPNFSWQNVASFFELTSGDYFPRLQLQLTKIAYAIFLSQPGHRFVMALSIANQLLCLHVFDQAGAIHSRGYNIHCYPSFLIQLLYALTMAPPNSSVTIRPFHFQPSFLA